MSSYRRCGKEGKNCLFVCLFFVYRLEAAQFVFSRGKLSTRLRIKISSCDDRRSIST